MIRWNKVCNMIGLSLLIITLSGCSNNTATVEEVMEEISTTEASNTEDIELEMDDVILQVGSSSVTYREVLFYIYQAKQNYEEDLNGDVWDIALEDGSTFEEYAKEELLREITEVKIICEEAKAEEITLTDSETAEAENEASAFLSSVSKDAVETYGFEEELLKEIFTENALADKMYDKTAEEADTDVDEEEYRQVKVQYIQIMTNGTDKDGNIVEMTDEEKEEALTWAGKVLKKSKTVEDFEAYAEEKTDAEEITLTFGKEDMPEEFGEAALALKTGEFSDVIEGDNGYYIIYCVSENVEKSTAKKVEAAIEELQDEAFQTSYTEWSKEYAVEVSVNLWKGIRIKTVS